MTDSIDTDALRARSLLIRDEELSGGVRWLTGPTWGMLSAAADEVDRLRAVVENAPHGDGCEMAWPAVDRKPTDTCTCWKADAL